MKAPILGLGPSFCENRGIPMHKQKRPLKTVPVTHNKIKMKCNVILLHLPEPGIKILQIRQNQASFTGSTGIAPFMREACSTRLKSSFGLLS